MSFSPNERQQKFLADSRHCVVTQRPRSHSVYCNREQYPLAMVQHLRLHGYKIKVKVLDER
jgi:hypothetical protein